MTGSEKRARARPWIVLAILTFAYTVGFIDRQVLNLLVQPIKADFRLSDLEISLLQGLAFSGAYMVFSPLFGRWVDVSSRRNVLLGALLVWSVFTGLCGLARNFWSLFFTRSGVGAAEAGLTPAAWSMLADTFDAKRLPLALSFFMIAPYLGGGLALLLGGVTLQWVTTSGYRSMPLLADLAPWQLTFILVSIPGLLCALLLLAVREPSRGVAADAANAMSLREVGGVLGRRRRFYLGFYVAMGFNFIPLYAFPAWMPAFAMRRFGIGISQVGIEYGIVTLVSGTVGVLCGPLLGRALERRGYRDAYLRLPMLTGCLLFVACASVWFVDSYAAALTAAAIAGLAYSAPAPLAAAALQLATPPRMRGMTAAIYVFVTTITGLLLAPTLVAALTDSVFRDETRVGESLAIVCAGSALVTVIVIATTLRGYRQLLEEQTAVI